MGEFCTISGLSKKFGVPVYSLKYWLSKWEIKESSRVGGIRVYDCERAKEIEDLVKAARSVKAFTSRKCPVNPSKRKG